MAEKTQQQIVDEANIAGQKASDILGQDFTAGTIETYFPNQAETKPTTPLPSAPTTPSQYYSRNTEQEQQAENILSAPMTTESTEQIQARKTKQAQGEIDALNRLYASKISEQREVNVGQERRTSSVSTLTGLAGSSEAGVQARKTEAIGGKQIEAIQNEQAVMIQSVLSDIRTSAVEEARQQTLDARQSAEDVLALRTQRQTDAVAKLTTLGQSATASLEGLRATLSPEDYDYLIRNAGGEAMANAILVESRDPENIIFSGIEGNKFLQITRMPDGTIKKEVIDLPEIGIDTTKGVKTTQKMDNGQVAIIFDDGTHKFIGEAGAGGGVGGGAEGDVESKEVSDLTEGILANVASLKDLTPSGREEVIAEIYRSGRGGELSDKMDEYAVNKANSVIPAIDLALSQLEETSTGFIGFGVSKVPGTDAFRLATTIDTIFANIAFGELTAMRAASPTGGALGQVSERELALLGSVQASLKIGIGNDLMEDNLNKVKKIFEDIKKRKETSDSSKVITGTLPDGTQVTKNADGSITDAQGNQYDENGNKI